MHTSTDLFIPLLLSMTRWTAHVSLIDHAPIQIVRIVQKPKMLRPTGLLPVTLQFNFHDQICKNIETMPWLVQV